MKTKEQLKREINALRQNICWVHGDALLKGIAEPSYGIPSGYDSKVFPVPPSFRNDPKVLLVPPSFQEAKLPMSE